MTIGDMATVLMALATTGSLVYISRQVSFARQQAKGQFLLALDGQFEKSNPITVRLMNEQPFIPVGDDWGEIFRLMSVFERINIMVDDHILDVSLVDRLHGFRLMSLIANDAVTTSAPAKAISSTSQPRRSPAEARPTASEPPLSRVHKLNKRTRP